MGFRTFLVDLALYFSSFLNRSFLSRTIDCIFEFICILKRLTKHHINLRFDIIMKMYHIGKTNLINVTNSVDNVLIYFNVGILYRLLNYIFTWRNRGRYYLMKISTEMYKPWTLPPFFSQFFLCSSCSLSSLRSLLFELFFSQTYVFKRKATYFNL